MKIAVTGAAGFICSHLAGQPGIAAITPLADYVRNNVAAMDKLLRACKEQQCLAG